MSLDQAESINLLESPDLLDGTVCLRRGPKMQLPLHLANRLIRAVAGLHCGGHIWVYDTPACQLINYRIRWGEVG